MLQKYAEWFEPASIRQVKGFIDPARFTTPQTEDDAYLQIIAFAKLMKQSPNQFVHNVALTVEQNPDSAVTLFLAKCYSNLGNALDFGVWLHSPKAVDMFEEAGLLNSLYEPDDGIVVV
jgi:dsDNA-binding SOS-regulon protein